MSDRSKKWCSKNCIADAIVFGNTIQQRTDFLLIKNLKPWKRSKGNHQDIIGAVADRMYPG
jgi:hypothetical protein